MVGNAYIASRPNIVQRRSGCFLVKLSYRGVWLFFFHLFILVFSVAGWFDLEEYYVIKLTF